MAGLVGGNPRRGSPELPTMTAVVTRGIMGEGFAQLRDQIETENDAPLTDDDLGELRTIARRLVLTEGDFSPRHSVD